MNIRRDNSRHIKAPTGAQITARSWTTEAAMRMLMNNLDPDVAEAPEELVVYVGIGRQARAWESYDAIVTHLKREGGDDTLLVLTGRPVGWFRTPQYEPTCRLANSNLVPPRWPAREA